MDKLFELPPRPSVPIFGEEACFPVHRIFCVGRNYAAHAAEMGFSAEKDAPFYFTKTPSAVCPSGATIPYPPGTENCHYEMELVVAIGAPAFRIAEAEALSVVLGYACGFDMTRRDLQNAARDQGRPWDFGKDFENAAVIAPITRADRFAVADQRIALTQNGELRQQARLSDMIFNVAELIAYLSCYYHLQPGDLLYTGTPAGVGPIAPGRPAGGDGRGADPGRTDDRAGGVGEGHRGALEDRGLGGRSQSRLPPRSGKHLRRGIQPVRCLPLPSLALAQISREIARHGHAQSFDGQRACRRSDHCPLPQDRGTRGLCQPAGVECLRLPRDSSGGTQTHCRSFGAGQ